MHPSIVVSHEGKRGCGWRKVGGLYLVTKHPGWNCGRLPIPLTTCPCCGAGFKPARGWTWVDTALLFKDIPMCQTPDKCTFCALHDPTTLGRAGLLWVGEQFYGRPAAFDEEVRTAGISRRINQVPLGFKAGETWILLAHRRAILTGPLELGQEPGWTPGVFHVFRPEQIDVIVDGTESDEQIERYIERGFVPTLVVREGNGDPTQDALLDDTAEIATGK